MAVVRAMAAAGLAILGGEVWLVLADGSIYAALPQANGGPSAVYSWSTEPWRPLESWDEFCSRCADEAVNAISGLHPEDHVKPEHREGIWFNLSYVTRSEYE